MFHCLNVCVCATSPDDIPATGTGTLEIQLEDVNDNAPTIDEREIRVRVSLLSNTKAAVLLWWNNTIATLQLSHPHTDFKSKRRYTVIWSAQLKGNQKILLPQVCNKDSAPQLLSVTDKDGPGYTFPYKVSLQGTSETNWTARMNDSSMYYCYVILSLWVYIGGLSRLSWSVN